MPNPEARPVAAADRVLHVLAVLAQHGRLMSAAELMECTGLARSTLYRQLARLKSWGFVLEGNGHYAPGPLGLQLALGFDMASHLVQQARSDMQALARQSRESVGLVVAVNDSVVCLDMVESTQALRCSFEKGRSVPLRFGASAQCLLAHAAPVMRDAFLDRHYGAASAERQSALAALEGVARAGYAVSSGVVDAGVWGVSVPLFGTARQAAGAMTLMAPILRAQGQEAALIGMAAVAAARISRKLAAH
ncbi:IclR family transcriptional regulator [Verminephrobacter aporrectodeae]|uniref:IclR family transcriptional regulator n=1 Tax=Verminephrobacter aporrectodeae TaxID=1110389 RepID=UPI002243ED9B|nr:IclR family transcriptional regulator [Verminephrobacter aporrectodeae]MCW8174521.1 IclR family transcriptional regulator [Verminephrobacter aporrectodeae subsp. tuberculatae]MCW8202187.1 IclR family transcriptional regulator [Verminephrobacter aporrectodeae subsp. tuberculatae]